MARIEKRGTGMFEREIIVREPSDFASPDERADALFEALDACVPDNVRGENAEICRNAMKRAFEIMRAKPPNHLWPQHADEINRRLNENPSSFVKTYFGEDHAYSIMNDWLCEFRVLEVERAKPDPDLARIISAAEHLGQLQERLWWRAGIDPETGEKREALALSGKRFKHQSDKGASARRGDFAGHTSAVLAEMRKLVDAGQPVSNAARLAATRGLGTSANANRNLWHRHMQKAATHP